MADSIKPSWLELSNPPTNENPATQSQQRQIEELMMELEDERRLRCAIADYANSMEAMHLTLRESLADPNIVTALFLEMTNTLSTLRS